MGEQFTACKAVQNILSYFSLGLILWSHGANERLRRTVGELKKNPAAQSDEVESLLRRLWLPPYNPYDPRLMTKYREVLA